MLRRVALSKSVPCQVLAIAVITLSARTAMAAPPVPILPTANDGYLIMNRLSNGDSFLDQDKVCPFNTFVWQRWSGELACAQEKTKNLVPEVNVQNVLDSAFGPGRMKAVGYAPNNRHQVVVFVRRTHEGPLTASSRP